MIDVDPDADGRADVLITYGPLPDNESDDPAIQQQNDRFLSATPCADEAAFTDSTGAVAGELSANHRGVAEADFNADGAPDLAVGTFGGAPLILLGRPGGGTRLTVRLDDPTAANRFGIGARVTLTAGERSWSKELGAGGRGSQSGGAPVLRFAFGEVEAVDRVEVRWPAGTVQDFAPSCLDCQVLLSR